MNVTPPITSTENNYYYYELISNAINSVYERIKDFFYSWYYYDVSSEISHIKTLVNRVAIDTNPGILFTRFEIVTDDQTINFDVHHYLNPETNPSDAYDRFQKRIIHHLIEQNQSYILNVHHHSIFPEQDKYHYTMYEKTQEGQSSGGRPSLTPLLVRQTIENTTSCPESMREQIYSCFDHQGNLAMATTETGEMRAAAPSYCLRNEAGV